MNVEGLITGPNNFRHYAKIINDEVKIVYDDEISNLHAPVYKYSYDKKKVYRITLFNNDKIVEVCNIQLSYYYRVLLNFYWNQSIFNEILSWKGLTALISIISLIVAIIKIR